MAVLSREAAQSPAQSLGENGVGDLWTWTAIDADTKLIVMWHLGKRTRGDANAFIEDRAERIDSENVQISTDGLAFCNDRSSIISAVVRLTARRRKTTG